MNCTICQSEKTKKFGKDRNGNQRFRCLDCKKTFQQEREKPLGEMTLAIEKAIMVLRHLVEGCSIRTTERLTGVHRDTILSLLETVGEKCIRVSEEMIQNIRVSEVQCDEIWGFVKMKQKRANKLGLENDATVGDAWCFVAFERHTKLVLAWHLGRRTVTDTEIFTEKLNQATAGNFEIYTDGFSAYRDAISLSLGTRVDFAQIIKIYGKPEGEDHRYSPPQVTEIKKTAVIGQPDLEKAGTSHVERQNLTIRMSNRRMTRLTNAFSKKHANLNYSYAIHFFFYNFIRVHSSLRVTPAMESKITDKVWTWEDLLLNSI
ncbi:MAG: IS1 family transposase [Acidobacteriota bacterium]|nr:IS1 family transposase [Acidobacteriota bacterium]